MASIAKIRPRSELIMLLIQPVASGLVQWLTKWKLNPLWIVLTHALLGFMAALLLTQHYGLWLAALLLQLKTLLDNIDGGLARATNQITQMGRYFDTGMDFFVNIALFAALSTYGPDWLCWLAFLLLTLILSLDFNAERLYKQAHLPPVKDIAVPIGAPFLIFKLFEQLYTLLFAPQDRLIEGLDKAYFKRLTHYPYARAQQSIQKSWSDLFSTASLVNLGLSTQMFILGLCLIVGHPYWYIYIILVQTTYVIFIQVIRASRLKRLLHNLSPEIQNEYPNT